MTQSRAGLEGRRTPYDGPLLWRPARLPDSVTLALLAELAHGVTADPAAASVTTTAPYTGDLLATLPVSTTAEVERKYACPSGAAGLGGHAGADQVRTGGTSVHRLHGQRVPALRRLGIR